MSDLSPLFDVDAPAGTYHGEWGNYLEHGQAISDSVGGGHWWCVNAGVMRLDPPVCSRARRQHVDVMIEEVQRIDFPTNLPEQYFLAERMAGWRHIDPSWNYEVGPQYADPGFTWPRSSAIKTATTFRGSLWHMQRVEAVHVFHFSGTLLHPWWYVDMTPEKAYKEVAAQWYYRDPKRMLATAVREWVSALNEVQAMSAYWPKSERNCFEAALEELRLRSSAHRWARYCAPGRTSKCYWCRGYFFATEGRWLTGWEGWWICFDCVVGYIFSDHEPPTLKCTSCDISAYRTWDGGWDWYQGWPQWYCSWCMKWRRPVNDARTVESFVMDAFVQASCRSTWQGLSGDRRHRSSSYNDVATRTPSNDAAEQSFTETSSSS